MPAAFKPSSTAVLTIAGVELLADCAGVLWHAGERALIVADLHLEKGSAFAARGSFLPPYDSPATLAALSALVNRYDPACIIALGDSFHDARAGERMSEDTRSTLAALRAGRDWIWIAGNHDPAIPDGLGELRPWHELGPLLLRHEPSAMADIAAPLKGEIAGHLHPAARVVSRSGQARRKCFVANASRCILPAFGAYTGGLNIRDKAFAGLFESTVPQALLLGRESLYRVAFNDCISD